MNKLTIALPAILLIISILTLWQGTTKLAGQVLLAAFSNQSFLATLATFFFAVGIGLSLQTILLTLKDMAGLAAPDEKMEQHILRTVLSIFFIVIFYTMQVVYFATLY